MALNPSWAELTRVLGDIANDAERDALKLDSQEITPFVLGTNFGNLYAAVAALANINRVLIERVESLTETVTELREWKDDHE